MNIVAQQWPRSVPLLLMRTSYREAGPPDVRLVVRPGQKGPGGGGAQQAGGHTRRHQRGLHQESAGTAHGVHKAFACPPLRGPPPFPSLTKIHVTLPFENAFQTLFSRIGPESILQEVRIKEDEARERILSRLFVLCLLLNDKQCRVVLHSCLEMQDESDQSPPAQQNSKILRAL